MAKKTHPADAADHAAIPSATGFTVSLLLGTGQFEKRPAASLAEAREIARKELGPQGAHFGRKPLIYASLPEGREVLVPDNYQPNTPASPAHQEIITMDTTKDIALKAPIAGKKAKKEPIGRAAKRANGKSAKAAKPNAKKAAKAAPAKTLTKAGKAEKAAKLGKRAAIEAAARDGKLPEKPDFTADTHKRFRGKLDEVVALVKAGDVKGLKAFEINPVSTSPKAIARYRDLCVIALEAKAAA